MSVYCDLLLPTYVHRICECLYDHMYTHTPQIADTVCEGRNRCWTSACPSMRIYSNTCTRIQVSDTVRESGKKWVPGICMLIDNKGLDELASKLVAGEALGNASSLTAVKVMQKVSTMHIVRGYVYCKECVCVCVCVCTWVCLCVYVNVQFIHAVHMYLCMYVCVWYVYMCVYVSVHTCICLQ